MKATIVLIMMLGAVGAACGMIGCGKGGRIMSADTPKQVTLKWVTAYNNHNPDEAAALYDENATNLQMPYGKPVQGREAMRSTYVKIFQSFPDIHVQVENLVENGQWVVVEWRFGGGMQGEFAGHSPNNSQFDMRGCEIFEIVDGKIRTQRGYWDKATMFGQLNINARP
jgi:steroid delta-isomerase-like uncharacterized protein